MGAIALPPKVSNVIVYDFAFQTAKTVVSAVMVISSPTSFSVAFTLQHLNPYPVGAVKLQFGSSYVPFSSIVTVSIVPSPPLASKETSNVGVSYSFTTTVVYSLALCVAVSFILT